MLLNTLSKFLIWSLVYLMAIVTKAQPVPDFSGVWQRNFPGASSLVPDPPMTSWAQERFDLAKPLHGPRTASATQSNAAEMQCLPMGFPGTYYRPRPFEIIQLPNRVVMLFEINNFWRIVYMDGRDFPEVPLHTWNGYSIGHYEEDTLVIETRNILGWESENQQRWLDRLGHPFSDQVRIIERIRRVDAESIVNEVSIHDPIAYENVLTGTLNFRKRDFELAEFVCQELMLSELPEMRPE
ncbi:MAG: hypothetical protein CMD52_00970 [Gammaproteobacteria bacterium]|jgi:hypothetical protein|nr:hypothetical protein [Gammaproteobacteria bacterium]MBD08885.1 hypothetical protein [Gammaproteobacteria bacterium]|tara:strand:+ start:6565 stop:7284 length:720 start_codon:yes stop_codon:yes gene_type:complete